MREKTLICRCGNEKELEAPVSSMGDVIDAGWGVVPTFKGEMLKVCPECHEELITLAKRIADVSGSEYVSLSSLVR